MAMVAITDEPVAAAQRYDAMRRVQESSFDLKVQEWIINAENAHKVANDDWLSWSKFDGMEFDGAMHSFVETAFDARFDVTTLTTKQKDAIVKQLFGHIKQGAIDYANFELGGF